MKLKKIFKFLTEPNDGKPMGIPVNQRRPPTLQEQIAQFMHSAELRRLAQQSGVESFHESEDFNIPDEPESMESPYERYFDPELNREISNAEKTYVTQLKKESGEAIAEAQKAALAKKKNEKFIEEKLKKSRNKSDEDED